MQTAKQFWLEEHAPHLVESLQRYFNQRIETGGFLRSILENDLFAAANRADTENRHLLFYIVEYIYNTMPTNCYGSPEAVASWLRTTHS